MSHLPSNTTNVDFNRRATRVIKGIQELSESDEELCALDYTNLSKHLAFASQEGFTVENSAALLGLLVKSSTLNFMQGFFQYRPVSLSISDPSMELSFSSYITVLGYFASENMRKTSRETDIKYFNSSIHEVVTTCVSELISTTQRNEVVQSTLTTTCVFLRQYLRRFRLAMEQWGTAIVNLSLHIEACFKKWQNGLVEASKGTLEPLQGHIQGLLWKVQREQEQIKARPVSQLPNNYTRSSLEEALLAQIATTHYDEPGQLRPEGPRHDNDDDDFQCIEIAPTNSELQCEHPPALPINHPAAPHHLPLGTMKRHLDVHFRLYREEFVALTRNAVQQVLQRRPELAKIFREKGGRFKLTLNHHTSSRFNLYTGVGFSKLTVGTRGLTMNVHCDTPPGRARDSSPDKRAEYWKSLHGKRLLYGSLVAVVSEFKGEEPRVYLGTIATSPDDLSKGARLNARQLMFSISFFDPGEQWILDQLLNHIPKPTRLFLVEVPVMYDAICPILRSLQQEPPIECFGQYLPLGIAPPVHIPPPAYSRHSDFKWNLACLLPESTDPFTFDSHHQTSVCEAIAVLRDSNALDVTQATAVVEALSRELSLIQGPPGTGKSRVVKDIIRVMIANNVGRILVVSFTNHTVDNTLDMLLDAGERSFVRLGGRSKHKRIENFALEKLEDASKNPSEANTKYRNMRVMEARLKSIVEKLQNPISEGDIMEWLKQKSPEQYQSLQNPPEHVTSSKRMQNAKLSTGDRPPSFCSQWIKGRDVRLNNARLTHSPQDELPEDKAQPNHSSRVPDRPPTSGRGDSLLLRDPTFPSQGHRRPARLLSDLLVCEHVWMMSTEERKNLFQGWKDKLRDSLTDDLRPAKKEFEDAREAWESARDLHRLDILRTRKVIGCTTAGAAKMIGLIKAWQPIAIIVEEAAQVLEAHTLASLVDSVEHLVLVGDHLQLRPPISNYALSTENPKGKIYRLDCSLLERLSGIGFPISQLKRQRRMRPLISDLLRINSYPDLEDDETVCKYPHVGGLKKDLYFLHHTNKESSSSGDGISKSNQFEASMAINLYQYLRRQGNYSITILATYLAQIPSVLDELRRNKLYGRVDERDAEALAEEDGLVASNDTPRGDIRPSDQVTIRTVDNYQGEEADIIILMLIRNSGFDSSSGEFDYKSSIGFLKNPNRINVALSRARYGLYILGNADDLSSHSAEWRKIIEHLKRSDALGDAIPLACQRHPDSERLVSDPRDFLQVAPDGGCTLPCDVLLPCGHACRAKCHPDHDIHDSIHCEEPCKRTCEAEGHLCKRPCGDDCDECLFPVDHVSLPCKHVVNLTCHAAQNPDSVSCPVKVVRELPGCEHPAEMPCHQDPATYICHTPCSRRLLCCGRPCESRCSDCQKLSNGTERDVHGLHTCQKLLSCGHPCEEDCATSQGACSGDCHKQCEVMCDHGPCRIPCSEPCTPCDKPCSWSCTHIRCGLPCAFPCRRPPCDVRCPNPLGCGHQCPSLCGEDCKIQICPECAPENQKQQVVEFLENTTLSGIWENKKSPPRLITLTCGHIFTVNTLDRSIDLDLCYDRCSEGWKARDEHVSVEVPTCPLCRSPIRVPRYTRIRKLAYQNTLDHKEARYVLSHLKRLYTQLQSLGDLETTLPDYANPLHLTGTSSEKVQGVAITQKNILRSASDKRPIPRRFLLHKRLVSDHGLCDPDAGAWAEVVNPLLKLYHEAEKLGNRRSGSCKIYERAVEHASGAGRTRTSTSGSQVSRGVEQITSRNAQELTGPRPPPDNSSRIRSILLTVEIRLKIAQLAQAWLSTLRNWRNLSDSYKELWVLFIVFIYDTCLADTTLAITFAESSQLQRQSIQCQVAMSRLEVQRFRVTAQNQLRPGVSDEVRADQEEQAQSIWRERQGQLDTTLQQYRNAFQNVHPDDEAFLSSQFYEPISSLESEWEAIRTSILSGSVFSEVMGEEKRDIRRAFEFDARGHWYKCRNGHPFVITECGGAMEEAFCPECNAPIGGRDHSTIDGVRQDSAMERLEAERGVPNSPWRWAEGA